MRSVFQRAMLVSLTTHFGFNYFPAKHNTLNAFSLLPGWVWLLNTVHLCQAQEPSHQVHIFQHSLVIVSISKRTCADIKIKPNECNKINKVSKWQIVSSAESSWLSSKAGIKLLMNENHWTGIFLWNMQLNWHLFTWVRKRQADGRRRASVALYSYFLFEINLTA